MRLALVALATLFFFGCETVQVHPGPPPLAAPPPRVALAEPYLDLWLEGAGSVSPQETEQGLEQAKAALGAALGGRAFVPEQGADQILVVQAQGLARTDGRRAQQTAAAVGIVLVVVALVVLIVASSRNGSRSSVPAGRAVPVGVPGARGARDAAPRGYYAPPAPWFGWGFGVGLHLDVPVAGPPLLPPTAYPTLEARLPARGFFDGDETELVLELRDARSGATLWVRRTSGEVDPRNPAAVRALLDQLVWDQPFARGTPPPAAPGADQSH